MNGRNHLVMCLSEVKVAIQEYLDKRWTVETPVIAHVELQTLAKGPTVDVYLEDKEGIEPVQKKDADA